MSKESSQVLFRRVSRPESLANASCEMLFLHRLERPNRAVYVSRLNAGLSLGALVVRPNDETSQTLQNHADEV